jgi:hypothetical protein
MIWVIAFTPAILVGQVVEKNNLLLKIQYFNDNNYTQHLLISAKSKIEGKFQSIPNIPIQVFIGSEIEKANLIGKGTTDAKGLLFMEISPAAKNEWLKSPSQNFVVIASATKQFEEGRGELSITKAKIKIDTAEGHLITAKIVALVDTTWMPMATVDMVVGVKRLNSILNANETATYTSDSTGSVQALFKRDSIPGDKKGNITIVAAVLDNDVYGNLTAEMVVPWGKYYRYESNFDHRTLFARRGHSPIWLEILAYTIVAAVWSVIIYLFIQIKQIRKIGIE